MSSAAGQSAPEPDFAELNRASANPPFASLYHQSVFPHPYTSDGRGGEEKSIAPDLDGENFFGSASVTKISPSLLLEGEWNPADGLYCSAFEVQWIATAGGYSGTSLPGGAGRDVI